MFDIVYCSVWMYTCTRVLLKVKYVYRVTCMSIYMCVCIPIIPHTGPVAAQGVYEAMPLSVEAFRVTKAWASGGSWQEVVATAAMAEGDVF